MNRLYQLLLLSGMPLLLSGQAFSFSATADRATEALPLSAFETARVEIEQLRHLLADVPAEGNKSASPFYLELPTPEGHWARFRLEDSPVMHPEMARRYPQFKSYRVHGKYGSGRMAVSPYGITAAVMGPEGEYFIERSHPEDRENLVVYYTKNVDLSRGDLDLPPSGCGWDPAAAEDENFLSDLASDFTPKDRNGKGLLGMHVYELALVCTGEFAISRGGEKEDVLEAYNVAMSTLNGLLEREVAARFVLIPQNDALIFLDPVADPFVNANDGIALLDQVGPALSLAGLSSGDFDLAHLFTAACADNLGGVVDGRACTSGKTRGVTCVRTSNIAATARGTMAHEIAHQFAVGHSWSNCPPNQGQLATDSAFEPGAGTTIMSYARACGDQSFDVRDPYYHVGSLDQFIQFSRESAGSDCATILTPENNEPVVEFDYRDGFYIPISTPFELIGTATDADGDNLLFNWEQYDLGPVSPLGEPFGNTPTFRSYPPDELGNHRIFPSIDRIVNNINSNTEVLPTYDRDLTFRLTARDNNPTAGASVWKTLAFKATESAGPFVLTAPNADTVSWAGAEYREITWDVANTDQAPVNCQNVDILLSTDGGFTYPIVLAENAPNTGSNFVTVPVDVEGDAFRVKVAASENIFFDISDANFVITPPAAPTFTISPELLGQQVCLPEVATLNFTSGSVLDFDAPLKLEVVSELPDGATANFTANDITPGESTELVIDFNDFRSNEELVVTVMITAADADTAFRSVLLDFVNNDFSDLALQLPAEGTQGVQLTTPFSWTSSENAISYDFQVASDPSFSPESLFETVTGTFDTTYVQDEFFDNNSIYFWRVRPNNECGAGPWRDPQSFRTINVDCGTYTANDTPVSLPGSGGSYVRSSTIFVDRMGAISDVNLPNITLNYQVVRYVTLTLVSPSGTRVKLYEENCFFTQNLDMGFDDIAPSAIVCPPDDKRVFQPVESLSAFNGEDAFGTWTLEVAVSETGGSAGGLTGWSIEFCGDVNPTPPSLVTNEVTECPPAAGTDITGMVLRVEDDQYGPDQLTYTLVRAPRYGRLRLGDQEVTAGGTFTQQDLNAAQLHYQNTDSETEADDFSFIVDNPERGHIPVNYHRINIFEGAISSVDETDGMLRGLELFPNPVEDFVSLRWGDPLPRNLPLEIVDVSGRRMQYHNLPELLTNYRVDMQGLPTGVYILRIGSRARRVIKR